MTGTGRGWLLLCSHLGNPDRSVLSPAQLRRLFRRVRGRETAEPDRKMKEQDLTELGYGREMARQILSLLEEEDLLDRYLARAKKAGCVPVTRGDPRYPKLLLERLGPDAPGCLWVKGDPALLNSTAIALVGSRDLAQPNRRFAQAVGNHTAGENLLLVSGNARGADRAAQESCLASGGRVLSIVADELDTKPHIPDLTFVSEEDFDAPFSAYRALRRNRCIHALGSMVFVAQVTAGKGGTWDGTVKNLRSGWSPVICFDDGSQGVTELEQMGAYRILPEEIPQFSFPEKQMNFLI